ncbi:MAG: STAS domain-containing protein [Chitinophagales bacterium]|nr:STAS domain-containing protein [Chitinophagales bacterium]MCZ2393730.1 STAS domain-containing protein [Chitinophagales bacterium]
MKFIIDKKEFYVIIELLTEKLMSTNAPMLKSEFAIIGAEGYRNLIIDLKNVSFVDSSGLSSILLANRMCNDEGGVLAISNIGTQVKSLIKISQLEDVLNIFSTLQDAEEFVKIHELNSKIKE